MRLAVPVPAAVSDTWNEWHLVFLSPWGRPGTALALCCAGLVFFFAWRALRGDRPRRRLILLSLRATGLLCALTLFFQPGVQLRNVTRVPNHIAVLLDSSASMNLSERAGDRTRAARAAATLARAAATLTEWRKEHRVDFFTFADRLIPASEEALTAPAGVPAQGDATRTREALAALRQRYDGRALAGVVLLSDGLDNGRLAEGAAPEGNAAAADPRAALQPDPDTRDFLRALDAPVHTLTLGHPGLQDVAIARVLADEFAFARTALQVEARLAVRGAETAGWVGQRLPVTLRRDGQPLLTVDVEVVEGQTEYKVLFPFTPERVGKYLYEITTPPLPGEAIAENNRRAFVLKVLRDKIRVVHVAGRPSYDVRFLRGLLKHDPNIDLVSFFILRSPSDVDLGPPAETSLIPFPCEELFQQQLRSFDLIILHNFNYNAYCGQYLQPAIVPFVQDGGAVAMVGGDLGFSSGGYYGSDVARVLPVELYPEPPGGLSLFGLSAPAEGNGRDRLIDTAAFRPRLTSEGKSHVVTALQLDVKANEARWEALPQLAGINLVPRLRAGASALLGHPTLRDEEGRPVPVVATMDVGKGRSLAMLTDSSWRWGFGVSDRGRGEAEGSAADPRGTAYQRFYEQAIRWLVRDPALRLLRVETADSEYGREQPVRIELKALGPNYKPAPGVEIAVQVARIGGEGPAAAVLSKAVKSDDEGEAHLDLEPQRPGGYRITARATLGGRLTEETEVFLVRGAGRELATLEVDGRLLKALSEATGGKVLKEGDDLGGLRFHPPHVARINRSRDIEVWDHLLVFLLATASLGANWYLRRRWGYV